MPLPRAVRLESPYVSLLSTPESPRSTKPGEPTFIATASFIYARVYQLGRGSFLSQNLIVTSQFL
ncbi:hypothetical protein JMJ77_0001282 [Colletotrichum scovillei]|uniref:Uncharacterized protein n=1 Tax=Colletotrichum scovillei TaxID=1209932 RepID=A0A9P7RBA0_9PEZI|nr:hypothetical protein JMJ77_0001282 [Colletotrichum scovillei]KAG7072510.1 hypothetical protein JMJ76_0005359 [Colletotrichum scovillei]KAG7080849.1 hypothetical protein JMJ78_0007933 [Colletotrichum scovillei]